MREMVERVARAIGKARGWNLPEESFGVYADGSKIDQCVRDAKAAIAAMRDPTDEMCESGWVNGQHEWGEGKDCEHVWRAMIDEALR